MHAVTGSEHLRIAVLASGEGSNLQAIVDAIARALQRANEAGIASAEFPLGIYAAGEATAAAREVRDRAMIDRLNDDRIDLVVLAGYMQILSTEFIQAFDGRIINVHPSLLPVFPGLRAIEQALESGATETGVTVHYVDEGVDTGPVIEQRTVPIAKGESLDELTARVHAVEHELLPAVIARIAAQRRTA
ncbi:MAG: phosphoribosylglycinamide formyltransferase [Actinobacteria bacterium]|nr:phosphoribosylglycinamide formyltransferase [Actinomycetota bacterium]